MNPVVISRLTDAMLLTDRLVDSIGEPSLDLRNGKAPSNTIGEQFWCVVGARESYARAISAGTWSGFSCSLSASDARRRERLRTTLARARLELLDTVARNELTDERVAIALEVLEHETFHHGQLVRYFYTNAIPFPEAFARKYALAQPKGAQAFASLLV